jgi:hypothetical protein
MLAMSDPDGAAQPPPDPTPPGFQQPPPGFPPPPPPGYGQAPGYYPPQGGLSAPAFYPPQPGAPFGLDQYGRPYSDKNKIVAGVLQLLFGTVGAGRWYTGHYGIATAQLLTCGGLGIWALIDGILMLVDKVTDPQGRPLRG